MNGFDISTISNCYIGGTQASAIYIGNDKLWPIAHDYSLDYFTIESLEDNNDIQFYARSASAPTITIQWSTDNGTNWNSYTSSTSTTAVTTLNTGDKMMIKATTTQYASANNGDASSRMIPTKTINIYGNIMSLLYGDNFVSQTALTASYTFRALFWQAKIVDASNLVLPATTIKSSCYNSMFDSCTSLTTAPELPATTLATSCYYHMFQGCTSLTTAPELPATSLPESCYTEMFNGCTSLTTTPTITVSSSGNYSLTGMFTNCSSLVSVSNMTLRGTYQSPQSMFRGCTSLESAANITLIGVAEYSYRYMFSGCTSLTTPPTMPTTTNLTSKWEPFVEMFKGCSSLITAPTLPATTLVGGCYKSMFEGCSSLTTAPVLPATTLQSTCYMYMFKGCSSLTTAPELPATTLATGCYSSMFEGCYALTSITCLATHIGKGSTTNWVNGITTNGTFTKAASMSDWTTGINGIPSGWTVVDA